MEENLGRWRERERERESVGMKVRFSKTEYTCENERWIGENAMRRGEGGRGSLNTWGQLFRAMGVWK